MSFLRLAVIMAGGSGERFWPLSNAKRPKQLLKLTHPEQTLLGEAVGRIAPLIPKERIFVATTRALDGAIKSDGSALPENVIAEPDKRNTLSCLGWVAANMLAKYPNDEVSLAVLTADHKIGNPALFRDTVSKALVTAEQTGALVTIGIRPSRAETGYGYIQLADAHSTEPQRSVAIHEKPDLAKAQEYLKGGNYLWNSGMFFWSVASFLSELEVAQPEVYMIVLQMTEALKQGKDGYAAELFRGLPSQSVDYALMEKAKNVFVVPGEFPWDDVGAWDALERSFDRNADGNVVLGDVISVDSHGCVLVNESKHKVGVLGVDDLVVVVSPDGILICHKDRTQEVRKIVSQLEGGE